MTDECVARRPSRLTHPGATSNTVKWTSAHQRWENRTEKVTLFLPHLMLPISLKTVLFYLTQGYSCKRFLVHSVNESICFHIVPVFFVSRVSCARP